MTEEPFIGMDSEDESLSVFVYHESTDTVLFSTEVGDGERADAKEIEDAIQRARSFLKGYISGQNE